METIDMARRGLLGIFGVLLAVVLIGGAYLWYSWSKIGSDSAALDAEFSKEVQALRKTPSSFTAPTVLPADAQGPYAAPASQETSPAFDGPAQSSGAAAPQETPETPSSFDAPV